MAGGKQKQPTVSSDAVAHDQLRAFVERILRMREEAKSINDDVREIYAEAKGNGFDKTVLGQIVSHIEKRAKDPDTLAERSALFDLYLTAFDGGSGHAYARASSVPDHEPALTNTTADGEDGAGASVLATQSTAAVKERPYEAGDALGESLNERWRPCAIPKRVLNPPVDTSNVVTLKSYANDPPHPDCLKPSLCKGYSNIKLCQPCIDAAAGFVQVPHEGTIGR